ncbi:MAG: SURF1 family protein [Telluria sp.]
MAVIVMRFRFRLIPFVAALAVAACGIALGNWQERRAAEKTALQERLQAGQRAAPVLLDGSRSDPRALEYRHVRVTGRYVANWPVYLDNRPYKGQPGFYVLMPLQIEGSPLQVLVARGWLPRDAVQRDRIAPYATPQGLVTVDGTAVLSIGHVMQLGEAPTLTPGAIVQNADAQQFTRATGRAVLPLMVEQSGGAADGLVRDWPAPSLGIEKHKGYAFQWYALAVLAVLYFVITGFRSGKQRTNP